MKTNFSQVTAKAAVSNMDPKPKPKPEPDMYYPEGDETVFSVTTVSSLTGRTETTDISIAYDKADMCFPELVNHLLRPILRAMGYVDGTINHYLSENTWGDEYERQGSFVYDEE